jgi:hypothetical protein
MTGRSRALGDQTRVSAETACEIAHKALPRKRHGRGDQEYGIRVSVLSAAVAGMRRSAAMQGMQPYQLTADLPGLVRAAELKVRVSLPVRD